MSVALIYGDAGTGKTVNTCRVKTRGRGKNLLLNSDYSSKVLDNFPEIKKNTDIEYVTHWTERDAQGMLRESNFIAQFKAATDSGKYDTIIVDNLTDIFDMAVNEMAEVPKHDGRRDYLLIYQQIKRLVRLANQVDCDVIFTCWELVEDKPTVTGEMIKKVRPLLQPKIVNQVMGLSQVVGRVAHAQDSNGVNQYYYDYRGSQSMDAKDQLFLREVGKPENLFDGGDK